MEGITFDFMGFPLQVIQPDSSKFTQTHVQPRSRVTSFVPEQDIA